MVKWSIESSIRRSVAQPGSASDLGSEGRRFESFRSDQGIEGLADANPFFFALLRFAEPLLLFCRGLSIAIKEQTSPVALLPTMIVVDHVLKPVGNNRLRRNFA